MKKILSSILLALICVVTFPMTGCSSSQTVKEINIILTETTNVLAVAQPNAPWVPQLESAVTALKVAEATWQAGGTEAGVVDALNAIVAVTAVVPMTSAYSPLIDVLVAGIETVMASFPTQPKPVVAAVQNPHLGRVVIPHSLLHSRTTEFVKSWNLVAQANPQTANAVIK